MASHASPPSRLGGGGGGGGGGGSGGATSGGVGAGTSPTLLITLPPGSLPLLLQLEAALVQVFGFMPDVAYGGAGSPAGALEKWYASHTSSLASLAGHGTGGGSGGGVPSWFGLEGNRDRTVSAASVASSVALATTSHSVSTLQLPALPVQLLHPSDARPHWFRQYVHMSAAAFVRVHAGGVYWISNRLPLGRAAQAAAAALAPWVAASRADASAAVAREEADDMSAGKIALFRALRTFCDDLLATGGSGGGTGGIGGGGGGVGTPALLAADD